jgi:hypothetical protein
VPLSFRNPANGYTGGVWNAVALVSALWLHLFCGKGNIWTHAAAALLLALLTAGFSWLIYPFFARGIAEKHHLRAGWIPV